MDYGKSKKQLNTLRDEYGEPVFRMGLTHLLDVGSQSFTEKNVEKTCKKNHDRRRKRSDDKGISMCNC